jgi:hypothetical protein
MALVYTSCSIAGWVDVRRHQLRGFSLLSGCQSARSSRRRRLNRPSFVPPWDELTWVSCLQKLPRGSHHENLTERRSTPVSYDVRQEPLSSSLFLGDFHRIDYFPASDGDEIEIVGEKGRGNDMPNNGPSSSFVAAMEVPTYAAFQEASNDRLDAISEFGNVCSSETVLPERYGPGCLVHQILSPSECRDLIDSTERLGYVNYSAGRNHHGALQIIVPEYVAQRISAKLLPFIDLGLLEERCAECDTLFGTRETLLASSPSSSDNQLKCTGLNRRWRFYRYRPPGSTERDDDRDEHFAPHIDVGFPPSGLSDDGRTLCWDITDKSSTHVVEERDRQVVSRLTVLMYLSDNFAGGETTFFQPLLLEGSSEKVEEGKSLSVLTAVKPRQGSCLIFPQVVGEEASLLARQYWPLHEGSALSAKVGEASAPKYVIRSDLIFSKIQKAC